MYNNKHHKFKSQYNHKLFAHCNRWGNDVIDYLADLRPKVIKFLDPNFDNVLAVRNMLPDALLIYRQWLPDQPLNGSEDEAFRLGYELGERLAAQWIIEQGLVNLVDGYNEVIGQDAPAAEHRKYASFQLGFRAALDGSSVEPIAFNFGAGNMSAELITAHYSDVLAAYQWLGFHEYDWPTMDRLHQQGIVDGNDGMWLALRYRRIMEPIIEAMGNNWSVIITECGMTQGVLGGYDVGFAKPQNTISGEWANYPTPISPADYWASLQWYSDELMKDDYVAGACMFVTGALSPWESFETIGKITPLIKDYQKEIGDDCMETEVTEDIGLKVLRLEDYESYELPFQVGAMATVDDTVFVDDLRANDDPSLDVVPRITTFEQLKAVFKLDIDHSLGRDAAKPGEMYWAVIGFYLRTGAATFIPKVLGANDLPPPPPGALVFAHWPGAPAIEANPAYHPNAVAGFTNGNGDVGFGYSGGAVIGPNGGVYDIWVSADPPGGTRLYSDAAVKLGWHGATNHLTPNPIFKAVVKGGSTPPPTGEVRLVVYGADGAEVGYTVLQSPGQSGSAGRIALVQGGVEVGAAPIQRPE